MKRCTETHRHPSFGEIPEGSMWDDDSPYLNDISFEDVDEPEVSAPKKRAPRRFGQHPIVEEG